MDRSTWFSFFQQGIRLLASLFKPKATRVVPAPLFFFRKTGGKHSAQIAQRKAKLAKKYRGHGALLSTAYGRLSPGHGALKPTAYGRLSPGHGAQCQGNDVIPTFMHLLWITFFAILQVPISTMGYGSPGKQVAAKNIGNLVQYVLV